MPLTNQPELDVSVNLLDAVRTLPLQREVEHCGQRFVASPFDVYAECPKCGTRLKVRSFSASSEIEDVFDAVFEWMNQSGAEELAQRRRKEIALDSDD